jgi:Sulfotransferase family
VFIVGMPRSGTTPMARIIARHPRGAGAGELPEMPRLAHLIFPERDRREAVAGAQSVLTREMLHLHAETYLAILEHGVPAEPL